ncbi:hypothetical protein EDB81DRAFT_848884 [Dactylonectria macrodidyma]|uniref:ferric-chelate reductase (NADPH) n=1 Tax=Dactylonectria macrodidyma TaxID=307937 RepID=A0A9P9D464_9HYPO|nr:hypothetical protein EDB81DRAFT_848884 [Dactylonectria macrodidyma]
METQLNATLGYAVGLSGLLVTIALRSFILRLLRLLSPPILTVIWEIRTFTRLAREISDWVTKHLLYRSFFRSKSSVDTCSRAQTILFTSYLVANLTCVFIGAKDWSEACSRAGSLATINALLLYVGPCFSFAAGILRLRLRIYHKVHASAGFMVCILASFHAVGAVSTRRGFSLNEIGNILAVFGLGGICLLMMPISFFSKIFPYEFLLFIHRTIAILLGYALWLHLPAKELFPRLYLYLLIGVFSSMILLIGTITLFRSRCRFHSADLAWSTTPVIQIVIRLQTRLKLEPGQYINLWIPSGILSALQLHPFTVTSWSSDPTDTLVVFAKIRQGFTSNLSKQLKAGDSQKWAMFTGPHGSKLPVDRYDSVFLVATGFGIVALLPYLQWLTYANHAHQLESHAPNPKAYRRVHLLWSVDDWGE